MALLRLSIPDTGCSLRTTNPYRGTSLDGVLTARRPRAQALAGLLLLLSSNERYQLPDDFAVVVVRDLAQANSHRPQDA
jgi:hypothetical protein